MGYKRSHPDLFESLLLIETDECVLWPGRPSGRRGYGRVEIDGKLHYVHRLALQRITGQSGEGLECRHGPCQNKMCMNARGGHLSWGTTSDNMQDRHRYGTMASKLRVDDVRMILLSGEGHAELARRFGVTRQAIYRIRTGQTWKHLTEGAKE